MTVEPGPIRRIVTGHDAQGRSKVIMDGAAHSVALSMGGGRTYNDFWIWNETPLPLGGDDDAVELGYDFPGPADGGHLRIVQGRGSPQGYDRNADPELEPMHAPEVEPSGRIWSRGGRGPFSSHMHKTQTIDYAVLLAGGRELELDDQVVKLEPGDFILDVGAWHRWHTPEAGSIMAFDMIAAEFIDGPIGLLQGPNRPVLAKSPQKLADGVRPTRRVVVGDVGSGTSTLISDGHSPDVTTDPARPGFASTRLWVIERHPAPLVYETLHLPETFLPPKGGSVFRSVTIPPDANWAGKVGSAEVEAFFSSVGAPGASKYATSAPHPYMQRTRTLEFCLVLEGEIVLVLDTGEVTVRTGEVVVQRGTSHAWSNRTSNPCVMAIASHDAR